MPRNKSAIALALIAGSLVLVALVGCSSSAKPYVNPATVGTASGGIPEATYTVAAQNFGSVGEKIYMTGSGADGKPIAWEAPQVSEGALLMGGGGCASCHGKKGTGGKVTTANGTVIDAPNVTYASLKKTGFTDATIAGAIRYCTDEQNAPLDPTMPCWWMTDEQVAATIAYLKTL